MSLNLPPSPPSPWFQQWVQMSSKDQQSEEYIKGLPIKTDLITNTRNRIQKIEMEIDAPGTPWPLARCLTQCSAPASLTQWSTSRARGPGRPRHGPPSPRWWPRPWPGLRGHLWSPPRPRIFTAFTGGDDPPASSSLAGLPASSGQTRVKRNLYGLVLFPESKHISKFKRILRKPIQRVFNGEDLELS